MHQEKLAQRKRWGAGENRRRPDRSQERLFEVVLHAELVAARVRHDAAGFAEVRIRDDRADLGAGAALIAVVASEVLRVEHVER